MNYLNLQQVKDAVFTQESLLKKPKLTLGELISAIIPYVYVVAGLILFIFLIIGGFGYLTAGADPKKMEASRNKITHALIGLLIVFLAYWFGQILEIIFGIEIF